MRIAMVGQKTNVAAAGGVEMHVASLAEGLASRGHDVTLFVRPGYERSEPATSLVRLVERPCVPTKHLEAITHTAVCLGSIGLRSYDVVHFHGVGPSLLCAAGKLPKGRRVISTIHDQDYRKAKWSSIAQRALRAGERQAVRHANEVIVVSRYLERHLLADYGRRCAWIPNGQDAMPRVEPGPLLGELGLRGRDYFLFTARLTPEKGCDTLIRAFRAARTGHHLVIAGGSSYTDGYVRTLQALAADDPRVHLVGVQVGDALAELRSNALAYVMPSVQEGLSIALLEALWYGLPAIVSDIPAVDEMAGAVDETRLLRVPVGDEESLSAALERLSRRQLRFESADPLAWPTWAEVAERVERVYVRVAAEAPNGGVEGRMERVAS